MQRRHEVLLPAAMRQCGSPGTCRRRDQGIELTSQAELRGIEPLTWCLQSAGEVVVGCAVVVAEQGLCSPVFGADEIPE